MIVSFGWVTLKMWFTFFLSICFFFLAVCECIHIGVCVCVWDSVRSALSSCPCHAVGATCPSLYSQVRIGLCHCLSNSHPPCHTQRSQSHHSIWPPVSCSQLGAMIFGLKKFLIPLKKAVYTAKCYFKSTGKNSSSDWLSLSILMGLFSSRMTPPPSTRQIQWIV